MHRIGITSFAYFPLSAANAKEAPALIEHAAKEVEALKTTGTLPPGRAEQLDLQIAALRNDDIPDLEVVAFPGFFTSVCEWGRCFPGIPILNTAVQPRLNPASNTPRFCLSSTTRFRGEL